MTGPFGFSDTARRISDACRQAIVDGHSGQWMAFALDTGESDGTCYLKRRDAIRHHAAKARLYMYIHIPFDDVTPRAAETYLKLHRQLAALGQHVADDEMPDTEWMFDNRREALPPGLDARRLLTTDEKHATRRRSGLIVPGGYRNDVRRNR